MPRWNTTFKHFTRQALAIAISIGAASHSQAANIYQVYQDAVANDPENRAAQATLRAEQEGKKAALGQMLPQIGFEISYNDQEQDTNQPSFFLGNTLDQVYINQSIAVTQKIFDLGTWYQFKGASKLSEKAELDFRQNEQELISRTLEAYLAILRAYDNLSSSLAEEAAFKQQLDQTRQRFDVGLVAITDVHESQAAYDLAKVNRLANQGILETSYEGLTLLTGKVYPSVELISDTLPILDPEPVERKAWVKMASENNINLKAATLAADAAQYNYKQAASQHLPTINASYTYNERFINSGELSNPSYQPDPNRTNYDPISVIDENDWEQTFGDLPEFETSTLSITLQVPIFSGGTISANRRKAFANYDAAKEQLNGLVRSVVQQARASHISVQTQIQTVAARKQAITSAQSAVDAIEAGYQVGTRNIVDILDAQRTLYNAERDYSKARYDYIQALFDLKEAAGLLSATDIQSLNEYIMLDKPATEAAAFGSLQEQAVN